jgi:hypothetical protein
MFPRIACRLLLLHDELSGHLMGADILPEEKGAGLIGVEVSPTKTASCTSHPCEGRNILI